MSENPTPCRSSDTAIHAKKVDFPLPVIPLQTLCCSKSEPVSITWPLFPFPSSKNGCLDIVLSPVKKMTVRNVPTVTYAFTPQLVAYRQTTRNDQAQP